MRRPLYLPIAIFCLMPAFYLHYQVLDYQAVVRTLAWSNGTLTLNVEANREGWRACKRFGRCDEARQPEWKIIRTGEIAFRV